MSPLRNEQMNKRLTIMSLNHKDKSIYFSHKGCQKRNEEKHQTKSAGEDLHGCHEVLTHTPLV